MRFFYKLPLRLRSLLRRDTAERELSDELRFHLEKLTEEKAAQGMSPNAARNAALRELGGLEQIKEECRDMRRVNYVEDLLQDFRYGVRQLWRSPGFSILALLCLTLGIGANAAVFSWIEGVLLRPFPLVAHQERLVTMVGTARGVPGFSSVSWPDFLDYRKNCALFDAFIAEKIVGAKISRGDRAEIVPGSIVSANYFEALGVHPVLGRGFEPAEETGRNAHPVTVISYQFWQERFHGDPDVIGKTQVLNRVPHTIVGVAPKGFLGTFVGYEFQFWAPASMQETFEPDQYKLEQRGALWIEGFARLRPGVTRAQAQQEISAVAQRLENDYPSTNRGRGIELLPLWQTPFNAADTLLPMLGIALVVVMMVLVVACANVGNLLLVRSLARRHEMTVRLALGARRGRLLRQLLTEGLILSALAAAGGIVVARWLRTALVLVVPQTGVHVYLAGELDWRVMALSAGLCLVSTLLFGLFPAIQTSKIDVAMALSSEAAGVVGGHRKAWARSGLVVVQVSLSFLLLIGAGLFIRSLLRARAASPGFSTTEVVMTALDLPVSQYSVERARNFDEDLLARVRGLGGVESAAAARIAPFSLRDYSHAPIEVEGFRPPHNQQPTAAYDEVSPGFFLTLGIPLLSGREFTRGDDESAPLVAIVNETMAAEYWHGRDPVGQRLQVNGRWRRVVGVARNADYRRLAEPPAPFFYAPLRQNPSRQAVLFIRTSQGPQVMAPLIARQVRDLDPDLALYEVITLREEVDRSTSPQRIAVALLGTFGGLALLLGAIGLYGVMSYAVSEGRRDLGLRMALGADSSCVLRQVLRRGMTLTAAGVVLGAAAALGLTRLLGYLLYNVSPRDPLAFSAALGVMILASLPACFVPAWRATKVDPIVALRHE